MRMSARNANGTRAIPRPILFGAMFLLFVIWSNSFHAISYFRQHLGTGAMALVTLRYGPVTPFCLVYCLVKWRETRLLLATQGWRVLLMGLLMVPAYNLALNWGQGRVPPATASLIITMNPVFTFLLAMLFLGERARWNKFVGLAVAFAGVYLLVRSQHAHFGVGYLLSALVVLIAPLAWASSTVLAKPVAGRSDPLLLTFAATGIGSLAFSVALAFNHGGVHHTLATLPAIGWAALLHLSILCTLVGFAVWFWALQHLPASTVSAFVFLNPPLTALFGAVWGTERVGWSTVVFGCITMAGVALSSATLRPRFAGKLPPGRSTQTLPARTPVEDRP
jgi:drug/metabolite transporter (DMT)-like permease